MQTNEYGAYDAYDYNDVGVQQDEHILDQSMPYQQQLQPEQQAVAYAFDDPKIASLPRILLMGPRRSGKTSIQRVIFQKMSPHETLFRLEPTQRLERAVVDHAPLCRFTILDFPGDYYGYDDFGYNDTQAMGQGAGGAPAEQNGMVEIDQTATFGGTTSLVFVMDGQDEPFANALQSLTTAIRRAIQVNPNIAVEVFINKTDGDLFFNDDAKYECQRDIMAQVNDELREAGLSPDSIQISYYLTSIYDHSIYEALSRVVQRLIPQSPTLENLLNVLVNTCFLEKAYLFDVVSKLYLSTDDGPVDIQSVELCSDMIDVVLDVSSIYGLGPSHLELGNGPANEGGEANRQDPMAAASTSAANSSADGHGGDELVGTMISQTPGEAPDEEEIVDPDSAYDSESASVIRLSNGMVLYLKEVDTMLALVCITRAENFRKKSLINYNIGCLKKALRALVQPITESSNST